MLASGQPQGPEKGDGREEEDKDAEPQLWGVPVRGVETSTGKLCGNEASRLIA